MLYGIAALNERVCREWMGGRRSSAGAEVGCVISCVESSSFVSQVRHVFMDYDCAWFLSSIDLYDCISAREFANCMYTIYQERDIQISRMMLLSSFS